MDGGREGGDGEEERKGGSGMCGGREGWGESGGGRDAGTDYSLVLPIGPIFSLTYLSPNK